MKERRTNYEASQLWLAVGGMQLAVTENKVHGFEGSKVRLTSIEMYG